MILVLHESLFAVTDSKGAFEIGHVPDGDFTLRVWSEFGTELERPIVVRGGIRVEESFVVRETERLTDHTNKFGRPYRAKY